MSQRRFINSAPGLIGLVVLLVLSGCNSTELLLDDDYNPRVTWGRHVVSEGETLYSVAMRYGWNYRDLAAANGIQEPYEIHPGDVIHLNREVEQGTGARSSAGRSSPSSTDQGTESTSRKPSQNTSSSTPKSSSVASSGNRASNTELQAGNTSVNDIVWRWPHSGPVIAKYSSESADMNKGIDIGGDAGDPIEAAADGSVVYAGSGLLGYGNLIIVNHSEHFLSAYAHSRAILVEEGEKVSQGETIAEMGSTGADRTMLHFEIRRKGDPVDPAQYLPPR
ncbi:peptidoglycan DD-metalloendopeptidase family protein [Halospina denitrificans]|nr:peptidoglycan DD-metalloendopeptidase family protein [Halospina denitrificans]